MKPPTSYWLKQGVFQIFVAAGVLLVGDGVLRDQNEFVIRYFQITMDTAEISLWQGFLHALPFGGLCALSLGVGLLFAFATRDRLAMAEAWLLQLVITLAALAAFWRSISAPLTAILNIQHGSGQPKQF